MPGIPKRALSLIACEHSRAGAEVKGVRPVAQRGSTTPPERRELSLPHSKEASPRGGGV